MAERTADAKGWNHPGLCPRQRDWNRPRESGTRLGALLAGGPRAKRQRRGLGTVHGEVDCGSAWRGNLCGKYAWTGDSVYLFVSVPLNYKNVKIHASFNVTLIFRGYTEVTEINQYAFGKDV